MPTLRTYFLIVSLCLVIGRSQATKGKARSSNSKSSKATNNGTVHGYWSKWSPWSSCDVTCGNGSLIRHRSCNNPSPNKIGLDCPGRGTEMKLCHLQLCPVNGGWSSWETWGTCSTTCGVGMRSRIRSCTNPRPDSFGDHCFGDSQEVELCNAGSCTINVAFNAYTQTSRRYYPPGEILVFPIVTFNEGQGYDASAGFFKAPVKGVYQFTVNICNEPNQQMIVAIIRGGTQIATTAVYESQYTDCNSVSVISPVELNENVFVETHGIGGYLFSGTYQRPSFSGHLMYQDG